MPYDSAQDPLYRSGAKMADPARGARAITLSDTVDIAPYPKAVYIGVAGDVVVIPINGRDDAPVTFKNHPVGYLPLTVRRVLSTGTGASYIVGLFH